MIMQITILYAGLIGLLLLILSVRVIRGRQAPGGPSLGDGGDTDMNRRIRAQGNLVEYAPVILIMMGLLEAAGQPALALHALGVSLVLGRAMHGYALSRRSGSVVGRSGGMLLTLVALAVASLWCIVTFAI
jgi:uncharacterized membrane protein YecN with MAPEG domain